MTKEPLRDADPAKLHATFRKKHEDLLTALKVEKLPFEAFECFRSKQRQEWLYSQGRTRPGNIITNALPGSSYHNYGLACDYVLRINGKWSWDSSRESMPKWKRLHELGFEIGLEPISWELPHLQLAGLKIADLRAGRLPV